MRILIALLFALPLTAFAQLPTQQQNPALYPYKKQMPPATVIESNESGGIPTDGTAMGRQLKQNQSSNAPSGPTMIYREPGRGKPTIITGPNGTTYCTDTNGRMTVCW